MRKTENRSETTEKEHIVEVSCDLCGKKASNPSYPWAEGPHEINTVSLEVRVRAVKGEVYPEFSSRESTEFDVCPDCFTGKVVPWMKTQGAAPRIVQHEA